MITDKEFSGLDEFALDEGQMEAAQRMRNLMWTVSGDYSLDTKLDLQDYHKTKYVAMYDAVKQGGFARSFDKDAFALYLAKKMYCGADQGPLTSLAQLCLDEAVCRRVLAERPGVKEIRREAFTYLLEHHFRRMNETLIGRVKLALMRGVLTGSWDCEGRVRRPLEMVRSLDRDDTDTMDLIRCVDALYNQIVDPSFEREHGDLEHVLAVTLEEMQEFGWRDFMDEEAYEQLLEQFIEEVSRQTASFDASETEEDENSEPQQQPARRIIQIDEEAVSKMHSYMELNFGRSYLSEPEQKALNYRLCRGAHVDCSLYYTDGILHDPVLANAQYVNARKHADNNRRLYLNSRNLVRRNVEIMTAFLRRSLTARTLVDQISTDHGYVRPRLLWRVGRVAEPGKLFYLNTRTNSNEFAVEILLDASGSQRSRQGQVALQAYIICASMSEAGLPHRLMSFCTFWDYTVMQRFRDFDDPPRADRKALEFTTSSNNRDGLAVRAAGDELLRRPEENKILIVLSDGRPNDVIVNRPGSRNPQPYYGEYAVRDTASEIRHLRSQGVSVLGVFTGQEKDLAAEKKIFGKDFAYIRDISNFSRVVSAYLRRLLEQDEGAV